MILPSLADGLSSRDSDTSRLPLALEREPARGGSMLKVEAVVVGAGVVGFAIARALALRGVQVLLLPEPERHRAAKAALCVP